MSTTAEDEFREFFQSVKPGSSEDRYARFAGTMLGLDRTRVFDAIAEALNNHKQTLVVGGNGVGKSYTVSALAIAALYTNPNVVVPVTAGNGDTVKNSIWKNVKSLWRGSPLPGDYKDNDRSLHTEFDDKWFLECHSPKNPEDLEGDHNESVIYVIEEAEKPGITHEHIDSARSTLAEDDHIIVLCNPPTDEANVVYDLQQKDSWHVLRFPTWESRNALVDRGLSSKEKIGGLSGVGKMQADWEEYHTEPWPGIDRVIEISSPYLDADGNPTVREREKARSNPEFRDDLHERWYKRRAGIMPPQGSETWRPFSVAEVRAAWQRDAGHVRETPQSVGLDVARSADNTVMLGLHDSEERVHYETSGTNFEVQRPEIVSEIQQWPNPDITVDSTPMGRSLTDHLDSKFPNVHEFSNGERAVEETEYRDKWAEGLQAVGEWLRDGGSITTPELREELLAAARVLEFSEVTLRSRGEIVEATSKERVKEHLGRSPDYLDSLLMAVHTERVGTDTSTDIPLSW